MGRTALAGALAGVAAVAGLMASSSALAAAPQDFLTTQATFSGKAGEPTTIEGRISPGEFVSTGGHPTRCDQATNILVSWGDGASSAPIAVAYTTGQGTSITARHTYGSDGDYTGRIEFSVQCTNLDDGFTGVLPYRIVCTSSPCAPALTYVVHVAAGTNSCPGQTASVVRIRQPNCPIYYTPALGKAEKKIFRQLAGIAYKGYLFDKAVDDVISFPGTVVSEGFFGKNAAADFVIGKFWGDYLERVVSKVAKGKLAPYAWMLDVPKYASYVDYVKYVVFTKLADDPPDPNFTALASPPKLRTLPGAPRQVGERDRREAGLYIALLTTVERAAGAQLAGATAAQSRQLRHASAIADQLVRVLGAKQKALKAAGRAFKRIDTGRLPRGVVRRAKRRLDPRSLTPSLRKLGFTPHEIAEVRRSAPSVPVRSLTAPLEQVLGLGAEAKTVGALRTALASFAKRYAAGR